MSSIFADVGLALRSLRRRPGFAVVAVLTLGVAIGANTAIYSVVEGVLLRPLPYPAPEELVVVGLEDVDASVVELPFSDRSFWHFSQGNRSFEQFGGFADTEWPLVGGDGEPVQLQVGVMTRSAFEAMGVSPAIGRFPSAEEDAPDAPRVALLSQGLWRDRFGGDPGILGRGIDLNGETFEVIGVMPGDFAFPLPETDAWVPYRLNPASENFGGHHIRAIARLRDGVGVEQAARDGASLISRFGEVGYGPEWMNNVFSGRTIVKTLQEEIVGDSRRSLLIILGTVGFVLLIACVNVANLLLVRAEGRTRETAVRVALGAGRRRLIQTVVTESVILAIAGGLLGLLLAGVGIRLLVAIGPAAIPRLHEIGISGGVLFFTMAVSLGAGILFGLFPAFRVASGKSMSTLRDGGRSATVGRDRHRARNALVIGQVAMALVLLIGSGLMVRSFQQLRAVEPGFRADGVITFGLSLPPSRYRSPEETARFYDQLLERLEGVPGVVSAAGINTLPLTGGGAILAANLEDFPTGPDDFPPTFPVRRVTPGYFETMGIPLVEGRAFERRDHDERLGTMVVSASLKERYWPEASPLGRRIAASAAPADIIGVVGDVRDAGLDAPAEQMIYMPMLDSVGGGVRAMNIAVRTTVAPTSLMPVIRREVRALDPALPLTDVRTMGGIVGDSTSRTSFTTTLLALAALVALFLGSVGIYGVISYVVTQRTTEMGVRQALGAAPGQVRDMVLRQGMSFAALGVVLGLLAAAAMGRLLSSLLYGISPFDPVSFIVGAVVFLVVAGLASLLPALRAARVAPAVALRGE